MSRPLIYTCVRYNSSLPASTSKVPSTADLEKINASKLLSAISSKSSTGSSTESSTGSVSADEEAKEWLEAIQDIRKEFTQNGTVPFNPSKAFSPDGEAEANLVQQSIESYKTDNKFRPTPEQQAEFDRLTGIDIPAKNDETIQYLTNVIMRHGRKARAQRTMSEALYLVQLQTRKNPIELLKTTLNKMAPVLKMRRFTDGGARAEMVPTPLNARQRLRHAWNWVIEASDKRSSKSFSVRLAEEIISASKGSGSGFEKKEQLHKSGIAARSFIKKL